MPPPYRHEKNFPSDQVLLIEVTGISAIGKSTFLQKVHFHDSIEVFNAGSFLSKEHKPNIFQKIIYDFFSLTLFVLRSEKFTISDFFWIVKYSMKVRSPFFFKFNIIRNSLLKFYYYEHLTASKDIIKKSIYVDEGISHLPFLLQDQLDNKIMLNEFYSRFSKYLSAINVLCLTGENIDTFERLNKRGHKRLHKATKSYIRRFDNINKRTLNTISMNASAYSTFKIIQLDNN